MQSLGVTQNAHYRALSLQVGAREGRSMCPNPKYAKRSTESTSRIRTLQALMESVQRNMTQPLKK